MKTSTLEKLVWVYIYAGLVLGGLGLMVQRGNDAVGWTMAVIGAVSIVVGAVLIFVRSKMKEQ